MSNICRFTAPASRDMESIIDYVADNSSFDAAERLLKKINEKCNNLANFPNMGRKRNELLPLLRSFPVDDYLIFYRAMSPTGYAYAGGIEILRIVSGYRNLDALFDEE
jgi:toxin ParE1/3/4